MNIITFVCGIAAGIILSIAFSFALVNESPFIISEYLPLVIGSFVAAIIAKKKPFLIGILISSALILASFIGLYFVAISTSGKMDIASFNYKILFQWILYLPVSFFGAYLGLYVMRLRTRKKN